MTKLVKLSDVVREVVREMDPPNPEWTSYLNRKTGELVTVTDEDVAALEREDVSGLPEWQREALPRVKAALESDESLPLPDRFEIHEWSIMERFAISIESADDQEELLDAIRGRGAFRVFRSTVGCLGLRDEWYRFRDEALEAIAVEWLESHGIPYERG